MSETSEKKSSKKEEADEMFRHVMGIGKPKKFTSVDIEKKGDKIILPQGMSFDDGIEWLKRQRDAEEQMINVSTRMKAFPFDGAYALYRAVVQIFGFASISGDSGPSGDAPPDMVSIQLPDHSYVKVPWGKIKFPGFDDKSYVETAYEGEKMEFIIKGQIKKKYDEVFTRVANKTKEILRDDSLYKGRAIKVNLSFISKKANPENPEFMDVSRVTDESILLTDIVKQDYSSVLLRIERTKECVQKNIPLKHGCLLTGTYGTGKTLLGRWTAKKAIDNGWTFIYLDDCRDLAHAIRLATMYAPAVLFAEDVDKATEGERSVEMNDLLNTLDGIDTKDKPIITVLTTNKVEMINKAFLRAGRIDSLIHLGPLDQKTSMEFIHKFVIDGAGNSVIDKAKDYVNAAKALVGIVPAFVSEIVNKAKMYAMYRDGIGEIVLPEDLEIAAKSFKSHIKLTMDKKVYTNAELAGMAAARMFYHLEQLADNGEPFEEQTEDTDTAIVVKKK